MAHEGIFNGTRKYLQRNKEIIYRVISKYEGREKAYSLLKKNE